MSISIYDYFYKKIEGIKKFSSFFPDYAEAKTPQEFYDNFISKTLLNKDDVIAWHKLLVKYIFESDDCIHFCRLYESGGDKDSNGIKIDVIRRSAKTIDGDFSYMFVSNHDASELCNMIKQGVQADYDMFRQMISDYTYKLHYQPRSPISKIDDYLNYRNTKVLPAGFEGKSIQEEYYILAGYPNTGSVKSSVLNQSNRYLAHIIGVKDTPYYINNKVIPGSHLSKILPRGDMTDWKEENGKYVRKINSNLTEEDKKIIKAHFLRFFDPLNYFVTPSKDFHKKVGNMASQKNIGEYWALQQYVEEQYEKEYGQDVMEEFRKYALVPSTKDLKFKKYDSKGQEIIINLIKYGKSLKSDKDNKKNKENNKKTVAKKVKERQQKGQTRKYTEDDILSLVKYFLNNVDSYTKLDKDILKCDTDRHGSTSFSILRRKGFTTKDRNILKTKSLDDLIKSSEGKRKEILLKIN